MPPPTKRDLTAVRTHRHLVRVVRRGRLADVEGYVVGLGKRWLAVLAVHDGLYAGHVLLRRADLRSLRTPATDPELAQRLLELDGRWPPRGPETLDLHDARSVVFTAGGLHELVALGRTGRRAVVGRVERITPRRVTVTPVTGDGGWGPARRVRLDRLTELTLGAPYVEKLALLLRPTDA